MQQPVCFLIIVVQEPLKILVVIDLTVDLRGRVWQYPTKLTIEENKETHGPWVNVKFAYVLLYYKRQNLFGLSSWLIKSMNITMIYYSCSQEYKRWHKNHCEELEKGRWSFGTLIVVLSSLSSARLSSTTLKQCIATSFHERWSLVMNFRILIPIASSSIFLEHYKKTDRIYCQFVSTVCFWWLQFHF